MERRSLNIIKIRGIQIRADYSWFVILALITWSFTANVVPLQFPELGAFASIFIGIVMTILFFASLLLHELSHALYAKSRGLEINNITLFIFGGAAEIREEPDKPGQEFLMAFLGPLTSIVLAGMFIGLLLVGTTISFTPFIAIGGALAVINFFLALFNLLPGLPLDGGRMLRATAWKITNNKIKATKIAANGGKLLSYLLIALGFLQIMAGALLGGVWLIFIALFLNAAAKTSYRHIIMKTELADIKVSDIMQAADMKDDRPAQLRPDDPIQKAVDMMNKKEASVLYVGDKGHAEGFITADSLRRLMARRRIRLNP